MADNKNANPATEDIAERTEGVAASNAFGVDGKAIMDAWGTVLNQATAQPRAVFEAGRKFAGDLSSIWFGSSDVDPGEADARATCFPYIPLPETDRSCLSEPDVAIDSSAGFQRIL